MLRPAIKLSISIAFSAFTVLLSSLVLPLKPILPHINFLLGTTKPTTYIILLQNDTEMRANGGFTGSYAKVTLNLPKLDVSFQDIYVPNGQLNGHVTPPGPIQQAFQHGTWELANADWEPDFPTTAKTFRWFFEKGKEINPDILVTINLSTIKKLLEVVGPFKVRDYEANISSENIYTFLQSQAETDFFPGSTQKKDALTAVGTALKRKLATLSPLQYFSILKILQNDANQGNLLVNTLHEPLQKTLDNLSWSGKINPGSHDTFMIVETNLGANKANCCIERQTDHFVTIEQDTYRHKVHTTVTNTSSGHNPNPPFDFSGHYISYFRLYIPKDAWGIEILPTESSPSGATHIPIPNITITPNKFGLTEIGFFHTTASSTTSSIDLSYYLATGSASNPYQIKLLKQNGLRSSPQSVHFQGKTKSVPLSASVNLTF